VVQNWLQISILLSFECMMARLGAHNFYLGPYASLDGWRRSHKTFDWQKACDIGANGVFAFQGSRLGVIQQTLNG